jgi:hypothetical protein
MVRTILLLLFNLRIIFFIFLNFLSPVFDAALFITSDCEKTFHIHLLILSNKNNTKQASFKFNLRKKFHGGLWRSEPRKPPAGFFGSLDKLNPAEHQVGFWICAKAILNITQHFQCKA